MLLYFAYGSNMAPRVMALRCPGARALGAASLPGWRFHVTKRGSASIVRQEAGIVHGVLWRCQPHHIQRLDTYEGVAWGNYWRRRLDVETANGDTARAFSYVNTKHQPGRARVTYMMTAVLPGARAFDLPENYLAELASWLPDRPIGERRIGYNGSRKPLRFPRR